MKERGIIFNTEMVRAILDGRKTVTRRPIKKESWTPYAEFHHFDPIGQAVFSDGKYYRNPFGQVGDRLYVRETWQSCKANEGYPLPESRLIKKSYVNYRADGCQWHNESNSVPWKPSIHMPKKYARIWLEITDIRVERVQDITEDQAEGEGFCSRLSMNESAVDMFETVWESIYKNWDQNPWVWAIEFIRIGKDAQSRMKDATPAEMTAEFKNLGQRPRELTEEGILTLHDDMNPKNYRLATVSDLEELQ